LSGFGGDVGEEGGGGFVELGEVRYESLGLMRRVT